MQDLFVMEKPLIVSAVDSDRRLAGKYLIGPGELYGGDFCLYKNVQTPSDDHSLATVRVMFSNKVSFCLFSQFVCSDRIGLPDCREGSDCLQSCADTGGKESCFGLSIEEFEGTPKAKESRY